MMMYFSRVVCTRYNLTAFYHSSKELSSFNRLYVSLSNNEYQNTSLMQCGRYFVLCALTIIALCLVRCRSLWIEDLTSEAADVVSMGDRLASGLGDYQ